MKKSNYNEELAKIQATSDWKEEMKQRMYAKQQPKHAPVRRYAFVATVCIALLAVGVYSLTREPIYVAEAVPVPAETAPVRNDLPILEPKQNDFQTGGMGYEAIMQLHPEDMKWDTPWDFNNGSKEMPVYKNMNRSDLAGGMLSKPTEEELKQIGEAYAQRLGFTMLSQKADLYSYILECEEGSIWVEEKYSVAVWFSQDYMKKYPIQLNSENVTKEDAIASLKTAYAKLETVLGFTQPVFNATLQYGYSIEEGELPMWDYSIYEGGGSQLEQLVSKTFASVDIYTENNQVWGMRFYIQDVNTSIGNYPIITVEQAKDRLLKGQYFASAPKGNFEEIVHVEMVYQHNRTNEYFMPYYKFYARLDTAGERIGSLKSYGAYYVPAIQDPYIKELPQNNRFYN